MKTIFSLVFLLFFTGCSTWNKDNEETQFLNELITEENSKNVIPLPLIKINSYSKEIVDEPKIPAEFKEPLVQSLAIKRLGTPDDHCGPVLFLLSDEAKWITGHVLAVDGGQITRI